MKSIAIPAALAAAIALAGCQQKEDAATTETAAASEQAAATQEVALESFEQKLGYAIGQNIGKTISADKIELDKTALMAGVRDALEGNPSALSNEAMAETFKQFQEQQMAAQMKAQEEQAAKQADVDAKNVAYLEANKAKEGVVVTESGLQYRVLEAGEGEMPGAEDEVTVHYRGTLVDGTEFDSSYSRGEPISFPVQGVIPGWVEGLQLMKTGSKYEFVIPSDLAYGPGGVGSIPPNSVLVFEVELISVQKAG